MPNCQKCPMEKCCNVPKFVQNDYQTSELIIAPGNSESCPIYALLMAKIVAR